VTKELKLELPPEVEEVVVVEPPAPTVTTYVVLGARFSPFAVNKPPAPPPPPLLTLLVE
jgi:hypothetical protein